MSDPFVAEIRIVPFNFAPRGWAFCDGQLLPIIQNTALFSLLGTTYGGDGRTTFALPNLQGGAAMHPGQGAGLTDRDLGESGGQVSVTLTTAEIPQHDHPLKVSEGNANTGAPSNSVSLAIASTRMYGAAFDLEPMAATTGAGQTHNNMQPYLVLNFIIALQGIFPPRS